MKRSRRYQKNLEQIKDVTTIEQAIKVLKSISKAKFDETVEVHFKLNLKSGKVVHQIRFSIQMPYSTGRLPKIAVFAEGEKVKEAKKAGADFIFGEREIQLINENGKTEFEIALATPDMMPKLAKIAKILGPKNLMPNPKNETVTQNIKATIEELKKGKVNIKNDQTGVIHQALGKISADDKELIDNYNVLLKALIKQKPVKLKGEFIVSKTISTTMGPGIRIK